jgi:hypothetical protein
MAGKSKRRAGMAERVGRYRRKLSQSGVKRVEVTVPARGSALLKKVASILRGDDRDAEKMRGALAALVAPTAETGADLVAFFRKSPFVGAEVEFERDKSTGRPVEF